MSAAGREGKRMMKGLKIEWQAPGSDKVHTIPEHATVMFKRGDEILCRAFHVNGKLMVDATTEVFPHITVCQEIEAREEE